MKASHSPLSHKESFDAILALISSGIGGDRFGKTLRRRKIPHLSYSQVAAVEFCEQRYYLDYIEAVHLDPVPNYFIKGKLMHELIASTYLKITNGRKIDPSSYSKKISRVYEDQHATHLENAVQLHLDNLWDGYKILGVERPFVFSVDRQLPPLVGVIDLLLQKKDQIIIVDHKTGGDFYPPDELQVSIYHHVIKQKFPKKKIRIYYDQYRWVNNLDRIRKHALQRTEIVLGKNHWKTSLERIREGYKTIKKIGKEDRGNHEGECFRCPFSRICFST